jgi:predicted transcriptional regulator
MTLRTGSLVPQKIGPEHDTAFLTLSRRQRVVYFLVDGRRSIDDLARCANKSQADVERILSELQEQGLIVL